MINKKTVTEKAEEYNVPFSNILSGAVCEAIVDILSKSHYSSELYLNNPGDLSIEKYKTSCVTNIYYEYDRDINEKMQALYLRDVLKEIISRAALDGLSVNGSVEEGAIRLSITVSEMYVPIQLYFAKKVERVEIGEYIDIPMTLFEGKSIHVLMNPKEEVLVKHLYEIISKLELINDMDQYLEAYEILIKYPINGRKAKDTLAAVLKENNIVVDEKLIKTIADYRNYTYMKKKWKVELRQKKTSEPTWQDLMDCLMSFLRPILEAVDRNIIFLGDWMPQIKRFLD